MNKDIFLFLKQDDATSISVKLLQLVLNTLSIGIQVFKPIRNAEDKVVDFEYVFVNDVYKINNGNKNLAGKTLLTVFPAGTGTFDRLVEAMNAGTPGDFVHAFGSDGISSFLRERYIRFEDFVLLCSQDITDHQKSEQQIQELNIKLSVKNRQLANLNSELQTFTNIAANNYKETLRNLYTGLEYIATQEAPRLSDVGKANVRRAQASIQKMKLLTEDIITYSSIPGIDKRISEVNLIEILKAIKNDLGKKMDKENIQIDCSDLPSIQGYPALLTLLFHHLIDNSIKFRKEGIKLMIDIRCSQQEGSTINHPASQADLKYDVISIIDNGLGFDQDEAEDIFTMFYRIHEKNRYRGSGIGLAICRKIMNIHRGFIVAQSEAGQGATFHCYFPLEKN
jgi:signal transduction histidine kinase